MNAEEFLKDKGLLKSECTKFVISGSFGVLTLNDLLEEYHKAKVKNLGLFDVRLSLPVREETDTHDFDAFEDGANWMLNQIKGN